MFKNTFFSVMGQKVKHGEEWVLSRTFLLQDIEIIGLSQRKKTTFASNKQNLKMHDKLRIDRCIQFIFVSMAQNYPVWNCFYVGI